MTLPRSSTAPARPLANFSAGTLLRFGRPWLTNTLLMVLGLGLFLMSSQLVREYHHFAIGFSGVSSWSAALYILAVAVILTQPVDRFTLPIIFLVAIACRMAVLPSEPYLSSDVYRYVWDGIVQHAHVSPYRYVPGDPALAYLRAPHQSIFDHINRRDYARTIYPPVAQILYFLITAISPTVTFMKVAMVLFEVITTLALLATLRRIGRRPEQILLYAWCPLLVWEIAASGHVDSTVMAFVSLALLARLRKKPIGTGIFLGVAVMIKFYPLVLLPALWWHEDPPTGSTWKMPAAVASVIAFGYACYAGVGTRVFGFLGGYTQEEGLESGSRYFLFDVAKRLPGLHNLSPAAYLLLVALVFLALTLWSLKTATRAASLPTAYLGSAFAFAFALMLLFSPHYPWYILWLVLFFALQPNLPALTYLMCFFYLFTTDLAVPGPRMFCLNQILYGATLAAFALRLAVRRWPIRRAFSANQPSLG